MHSFASAPPSPSPKKNSFICSTRNSCASRVHGCRRYSFSNIFCRSTHSAQLFFETFLKIFCPKSESNGGSSSPSISALNLVSKTICAIVLFSCLYFDCSGTSQTRLTALALRLFVALPRLGLRLPLLSRPVRTRMRPLATGACRGIRSPQRSRHGRRILFGRQQS